jgi:hypothetical protein
MSDRLWAITAFYNPAGFQRRVANFRIFRNQINVPLLVVELSFGGAFQLDPSDADIVVRCLGGAVLWQKERLLNVALAALPADVVHVAWLDCDIVFEGSDWGQCASSALGKYKLVQLYSHVIDLDQDEDLQRLFGELRVVFHAELSRVFHREVSHL